uniref:SMI1/KNR4 family protein n=1 Tax=Thaumasiovibrio occultus TaxID=1891184 RepID=UPI000B35ED0D|nr:SMI1/KNR4 family protein [Thaumasiovibrio occultus]
MDSSQFEKDITTLERLLAQSQGQFIEIGAEAPCSFTQLKAYSDAELTAFEEAHSLRLPAAYRDFLLRIGACEVFSFQGSHRAITFYPLDEIFALYADCFAQPEEWLFDKFLPIGIDNSLQESLVFGFGFSQPQQFFLLYHDYYLDELDDENDPHFPAFFTAFERYLCQLITHRGRLSPH